MSQYEDVDPERAWIAAAAALVVGVVGGSLAFPEAVYGEFVWHYFVGPVYADANGAACAAWDGGARALHYSATACQGATEPVAYPGYTLVSEVGYMVTLVLALGGVILLLRRLDVGTDRGFFYALLPFMFFGGALRVVEDAFDAARAAGESAGLGYPASALIISPFIYFTMFAITLAVLAVSVELARSGRVERYERPLFGAGAALLVASVGYLGYLAATTAYVEFHPQMTLLTLLLASVVTAGLWWLLETYWPEANSGTRYIGAVVIWGHAVDGVANVLGIDWGQELGLRADLVPKHPVNRAVIEWTAQLQPASITAVVGDAWPFLLLKLAAATFAVWLFNDEIIEDSPRYSILLLVAVLAVGLGPGTRDMLRATFGI